MRQNSTSTMDPLHGVFARQIIIRTEVGPSLFTGVFQVFWLIRHIPGPCQGERLGWGRQWSDQLKPASADRAGLAGRLNLARAIGTRLAGATPNRGSVPGKIELRRPCARAAAGPCPTDVSWQLLLVAQPQFLSPSRPNLSLSSSPSRQHRQPPSPSPPFAS